MILSVKAKEAIKTSLAFAIVYGIALRLGWLNPYWAGWAVAMVSLTETTGQSLHKGFLRVMGTIPACAAAIVILGLAPQSRWAFIALASGWLFFTTYMMIGDKRHPYFWVVAGYVSLIILGTGPSSPEDIFQHAMFRTIETAMGVVVYSLVMVFIWPRNSAGAIKQASKALLTTQGELIQVCGSLLNGRGGDDKLMPLHTQEVKQLAQLGQALESEGSESYQVQELRPLWEQFRALSTQLIEAIDRLQISLRDVAAANAGVALPCHVGLLAELQRRFAQMTQMLNSDPLDSEMQAVPVSIDRNAAVAISHFERAALAVTKQQLDNLERLTRSMFACVKSLSGNTTHLEIPQTMAPSATSPKGSRLPIIDGDRLWRALFPSVSMFAGFLVWIYFNPPGHGGWFEIPGIVAIAVAGTPQIKTTVMVKPLGVASVLGIAVYVLIMPQLSSFAELGSLLFILIFIVCYFLPGPAKAVGMFAVLNTIAVQNEQMYSFAAMANITIFILLAFTFVTLMSYLVHSPRPEKALLRQVSRFFRCAELLFSRPSNEATGCPPFIERWRAAHHRHEIAALPQKIGAWGRSINRSKFPSNTPEQVGNLVAGLQVLMYRIEELLAVGAMPQADSRVRQLGLDIQAWRAAIKKTFRRWSEKQEFAAVDDLRSRLTTGLSDLETRIEEILSQATEKAASEGTGEQFYRLLGGYRGVSEAALAYASIAGAINWAEWEEERF